MLNFARQLLTYHFFHNASLDQQSLDRVLLLLEEERCADAIDLVQESADVPFDTALIQVRRLWIRQLAQKIPAIES